MGWIDGLEELLKLREENKELKKDLEYATRIASQVLLKVGHRGSNQEDRNHDEQYEKIHDIRTKYKMT